MTQHSIYVTLILSTGSSWWSEHKKYPYVPQQLIDPRTKFIGPSGITKPRKNTCLVAVVHFVTNALDSVDWYIQVLWHFLLC